MADGWIFPKLLTSRDGIFYTVDVGQPAKLCWHTTNVGPVPADINTPPAELTNWVPRHESPPHLWADPVRKQIFQSIDFNFGGLALFRDSTKGPTNGTRCLQVEINHWAEWCGSFPEEWLKWLGEEVQAPMVRWMWDNWGQDSFDIDNTLNLKVLGGSASVNGVERLSQGMWENFSGSLGHVHIPQNDHFDAGLLNISRIAEYAKARLVINNPPPVVSPEVDMTPSESAQLLQIHGAIAAISSQVQVLTNQVGDTWKRVASIVPRFNGDGTDFTGNNGPVPAGPVSDLFKMAYWEPIFWQEVRGLVKDLTTRIDVVEAVARKTNADVISGDAEIKALEAKTDVNVTVSTTDIKKMISSANVANLTPAQLAVVLQAALKALTTP